MNDNNKLKDVRAKFKEMYDRDLEDAFKDEASGAFQKLIIGLHRRPARIRKPGNGAKY